MTRLLTVADVPQGMALKQVAGWNQTERDWLRLLELEPEGCWGIDGDGRLVSTATALCYGTDLAWIGMVLTHPDYRGRGFASRLMERALEFTDRRGVECVKLDATDMGAPIYRKFGFHDECAIERWSRVETGGKPAGHLAAAPFVPDWGLDREAFGADRKRLLSALPLEYAATIAGEGFAMGRPGSNSLYFGPCVSRSAAAARSLVMRFLDLHPSEPVFWDILPENRAAAELASELGFAPVRRLIRMARGPSPPVDNCKVYAIADFACG